MSSGIWLARLKHPVTRFARTGLTQKHKSTKTQKHILTVHNLSISFDNHPVVRNLSFSIERGKTLAIVGESGSGKSVSSLAVMGLLDPKAAVHADQMNFSGIELAGLSADEHRALRGRRMAMIFQEPMTALNPSMTCGEQVAENIRNHERCSAREARGRTLQLFREVHIPTPEEKYRAWPHQLSGGQRQRVMIAMALSCSPELLIADEPTTALDVTVQGEILTLLRKLQQERNMAVLFISHDLGVVARVADEVLVLYRGETMEYGPVQDVLNRPQAAYTKGLLACRPPLDARPHRLTTVQDIMGGVAVDTSRLPDRAAELEQQKPLLEISGLEKWFPAGKTVLWGKREVFRAVDGVSVVLYPGETLGLVGESGCGKSTLSRCLVRLYEPDAGEILWKGRDIAHLRGTALRELRKEIQMIFQDPFGSLNPRARIGDLIAEPMEVHGLHANRAQRKAKTALLLERVGLTADDMKKYAHEFSGGQRQRIGIARALAVEPELLICDESVSALDVSVQAQVLNLLNELRDEFGFSYLFISHDLSVVKYMSDHLMVMKDGKLEEYGRSEVVYNKPESAYTRRLIEAIPKV